MADAGRLHPDQDLAGPRLVDLQLLDGERCALALGDRRADAQSVASVMVGQATPPTLSETAGGVQPVTARP
ncbi:MAG TPA: hypothetical protein VFN87_00125 [Solirubrobacteraceae bacterium]|nr:hypothetical protein [Solirubrobacteraceae bacterium]